MLNFETGNSQEKIGTSVFYRQTEIGIITDFNVKENYVKVYLTEDGKKVMNQVTADIENGTLTFPIQ
jgi:hypothetical protein